MATHVKVIAGVFLFVGAVLAALAFLGRTILAGIAGAVATSGDPDAAVGATILGFAGIAVPLFFGILAAAFVITGWGLIKLKPAARIAGIILAAVCLTNVPIGTAFGIYAMIILFKKDTEALFTGPVATINT